jgi:hypothetical protein
MVEQISRCLVCFENWNLNTRIYACGAFVCKNCHKKLFEDDHEVSCLNCKVLINYSGHYITGPILINAQEMEKKKLVQCDYDSCDEKMLMKDLDDHQTKCLYKWIYCTKCDTEMLKIVAYNHELYCDGRDVNCESCGAIFPYNQSKEHVKICPNATITCSCKITLLRKDVPLHKETCDFTIISCSNKKCIYQFSRKDMDYHKSQCEFELVKCQHCEKETQRKDLLSHLTRFNNDHTCSEYPFRCDGCRKKMPIKYLAKHAMHECSKRNAAFDDSKPLEIGMVVDIKNETIWMKYLIVGKEDSNGIFYSVMLIGNNQFLPNIKTMNRNEVDIACNKITNEPLLVQIKELYGISCTPKHPTMIDIFTGLSYCTESKWTTEEDYINSNIIVSCEIIQSFPDFYRIRFESQDFYIHRTMYNHDKLCVELKIGNMYTVNIHGTWHESAKLESIQDGKMTFRISEKAITTWISNCDIYPFNFCPIAVKKKDVRRPQKIVSIL